MARRADQSGRPRRPEDDWSMQPIVHVLKPGATIGILGGGQLGRMLALAAARLGLHCHVYSPETRFLRLRGGAPAHLRGLRRRRARCGASPQRSTSSPTSSRTCRPRPRPFSPRRKPVLPDPQGAGDDAGPADREGLHRRARHRHRALRAGAQRDAACRRASTSIGLPAVLKTRQLGYDGKGQAKIDSGSDPTAAWRELAERALHPGRLHRLRARGLGHRGARARRQGRMLRRHRERAPRPHPENLAACRPRCRRRSPPRRGASPTRIAKAFDYVGVLAVEMFVVARGAQAARAGQRDRAARAQFRALDHRRRDRLAIRAAHPRGRRLAAGQAAAARPRRDDQPDRRRNRRGRALARRARRVACISTARARRGRAARWAT